MKKIFIIIILSLLVVAPLVTALDCADMFQKGEVINFTKQAEASDGSPATAAVSCSLTLKDPDTEILINDQTMDFGDGGHYSYIISDTLTANKTGKYKVYMTCNDGVSYGSDNYCIEITPTGVEQDSVLWNPVLLIFLGLAVTFLIMGIYFSNSYLGFLSGILFVLSGVYTMIYGFNNVTTLYTRASAIVLIALGVVFMLGAAFDALSD